MLIPSPPPPPPYCAQNQRSPMLRSILLFFFLVYKMLRDKSGRLVALSYTLMYFYCLFQVSERVCVCADGGYSTAGGRRVR